MVKRLDDLSGSRSGELQLDHIGIHLWDANRLWLALFGKAMNAAGHGWFGPAQANLLGQLDRDGVSQAVLVQRLGLSKQAVQQLVDDLERNGVVRRNRDPADRRARIVRYTDYGLAALKDADAIKLELEARFRTVLGEGEFKRLRRSLRTLLASDLGGS